ncbi:MAG: MFS transporter [Methanobrevibacter sp.]|uniref:MFS transporter n=1 Tax=Methanobrevibacter sp. TaxID=66852 RepID=UPI002E7A6EE4|nr:MFS transporter [Methanobrevibacter sp.]MEE0935380.1 MFS transporter [Methanobrevibacter sp.]
MNAELDEDRIFTKSFFLVFGALLFTALVMYVLMSTVTEYATAMGSSAMIAGLVSGIYIFGGLCSRIYSGNALERIGWKKTALIFMGIHFISCLLYFLVSDVTLLVIVRFIHGIGFGASANAIVTIASDVLPKKRFGEAFGYFMLGTTLAVGLGPFIGGFAYDFTGSNGCFLLASIFSALALISIYFVDVSAHDPGNNPKAIQFSFGIDKVFEVSAIPVSFFTALTSLGYISILSFNRLYAAEINLTSAFSWFFIIYCVILIVSRPIAGKVQDKGGDMIVCVTGIVAQAIGLFLIAVYPSTLTVIICAVCAALGFGTLNSACTTIVTRNVSENRRSYAVSTFFIFCDATMGFGPALLGIFAANGYAPVYLISSIITLLALPVCIFALRK